MSRRMVWLGRAAAVVALVLVLGAAWVMWVNHGSADERAFTPAPSTPESAQRGAYLARVGNCMSCHTERGGAPYAGGRGIATPFGTVYAGNLTPDADTGLGRWDAGDLWRALHLGVSRDGRALYPAFPYTHYTRLTRADVQALYDHLRTLTPVRQVNRPHELQWPYNAPWALAVWRAMYFRPEAHRDEPAQSADWKRGAYLVRGLGHCSACHSGRDALGGQRDLLDLSGGLIPMQNWYAPSLTAKGEASVADWTLPEIEQLLLSGVAARGSVLGPMAEVVLGSTQYLNDRDARAMAVFLKALPVTADEPVRAAAPAPQAVIDRGRQLYADRCASCHGEQGEGVVGAYPPLAGNRAVTLAQTNNLVQVVLHGGFAPATRGHPRPFGMPPFATTLSDAEVAQVLTYIRSAWGHRAAPVSELAVSVQRDNSASR